MAETRTLPYRRGVTHHCCRYNKVKFFGIGDPAICFTVRCSSVASLSVDEQINGRVSAFSRMPAAHFD